MNRDELKSRYPVAQLNGWNLCSLLVAVAGLLVVSQVVATAQIEDVDRIIYVAKSIKKLVVTQVKDSRLEVADKKTEAQSQFEIAAYDKDGKEVNVPSDQVSKLYKWKVSDSSGAEVEQKGVLEQVDSANDKARKVRNILKLFGENGQKSAKLEVRLADQYASYSDAVGKSTITSGKAGFLKSVGRWIGDHPYWSTAGAVVIIGGGAALAGGGGGGSSSGNTSSGTTSGNNSVPAGTVDVSGTWYVSSSDGGSSTMVLSQSGTSVSGTVQDGPLGNYKTGTVSGSVSGSTFSFTVNYPNESSGYTAVVNGNTMSGTSFTASR